MYRADIVLDILYFGESGRRLMSILLLLPIPILKYYVHYFYLHYGTPVCGIFSV